MASHCVVPSCVGSSVNHPADAHFGEAGAITEKHLAKGLLLGVFRRSRRGRRGRRGLSSRSILITLITLTILPTLPALSAQVIFSLAVSVVHSCLEHALFYAALGDEALLHGDEQFVEHVDGLVGEVRHRLAISSSVMRRMLSA